MDRFVELMQAYEGDNHDNNHLKSAYRSEMTESLTSGSSSFPSNPADDELNLVSTANLQYSNVLRSNDYGNFNKQKSMVLNK